jgi:hypothetical protein
MSPIFEERNTADGQADESFSYIYDCRKDFGNVCFLVVCFCCWLCWNVLVMCFIKFIGKCVIDKDTERLNSVALTASHKLFHFSFFLTNKLVFFFTVLFLVLLLLSFNRVRWWFKKEEFIPLLIVTFQELKWLFKMLFIIIRNAKNLWMKGNNLNWFLFEKLSVERFFLWRFLFSRLKIESFDLEFDFNFLLVARMYFWKFLNFFLCYYVI